MLRMSFDFFSLHFVPACFLYGCSNAAATFAEKSQDSEVVRILACHGAGDEAG